MRTASTDQIVEAVAAATGIPAHAILGPERSGGIARARFITVSLIRRHFPLWSLKDIASAVSRTDHGTIINALRRSQKLLITNPHFAQAHTHAATLLTERGLSCPP